MGSLAGGLQSATQPPERLQLAKSPPPSDGGKGLPSSPASDEPEDDPDDDPEEDPDEGPEEDPEEEPEDDPDDDPEEDPVADPEDEPEPEPDDPPPLELELPHAANAKRTATPAARVAPTVKV